MLQRPVVVLVALLLAMLACPIFLPLAPLLGYPALFVRGASLWFRWSVGTLKRPGQVGSVWAMFLGFVMILHGIVLCFDTSLAGAPPTAEAKRFGNRLAYLGAAVAGTAAVAAYALEPGRWRTREGIAKPDPLDDVTV